MADRRTPIGCGNRRPGKTPGNHSERFTEAGRAPGPRERKVPPERGLEKGALIMAENDTPAEAQQGQQIQLRIDESKMSSTYANTIRTSTTQDEVIMDFGMNIPQQVPGQAPVMNFSVGGRVVMNWAGAKRLAISVGQLIRNYEQQFGEIQLQRPQPGPAATDPADEG